MFLKQDKRPNGRVYLSIVKSFRDPVTKKNKQKAVKSIGFYDELIHQYEDPIAHFKEVAKEMTEREDVVRRVDLSIDLEETLAVGTNDVKKYWFLCAEQGLS